MTQYAIPTDRVMDQAIQREVRALHRDGILHGRKMFVMGMVVGALLMLLVGCQPCHKGHSEVYYRGAYTTTQMVGKVPIMQYHPAACHESVVCDFECRALDAGKDEAHTKHEMIHTGLMTVDDRCERGGRGWRVK